MSAGRIDRLLAVARRCADPHDPLGKEARAAIFATSGLSPEGVELALTEHLEIDPAPADLRALLAAAEPAPRCHVLLSANVCTAPLRAIALALAAAPTVIVRPSRRDPALATVLTRELDADPAFTAGASIALAADLAPSPGDALHAYGSDETLAQIAAALPAGVALRAHGTGLGVAVVSARADLDEAARALARDVIAFDQRGCLSPRAALIEGSADRAEGFARALDRALASLSLRVPRGPLDDAARAEIALYRATIEAIGALHEGRDHLVGLDPSPRALVLPPAARVVHVVPASAADAPALLAPWARYVTTVGSDDAQASALAPVIHAMAPRARHAALGSMQRPPLDGPVDLR